MANALEIINPNELKTPKTCSLYRAINYLAFSEKPIDEDLAKLLYPKRYSLEIENHSYEYHEWQTTEIYWQEGDEATFEKAAKNLHALLILGDIKAYGTPLTEPLSEPRGDGSRIKDWYKLTSFGETEELFKDFWSGLDFKIDYLNSEAKNTFHFSASHDAFTNIQISCEDLLNIKNVSNSKTSKQSGRKEKYDWKKQIYPEILNYFYEGADIKKSGEHHAKEVWSICSQKFGEENTPPIETLRTEAVAPILRRLRFEEN